MVTTTSNLVDSVRDEYVERYLRMVKDVATYDSIEATIKKLQKCLHCTTPYEGKETSCIKCGAPRVIEYERR